MTLSNINQIRICNGTEGGILRKSALLAQQIPNPSNLDIDCKVGR